MGNYKVEGIVLKARDFGEADRILTILDRDLGKLEGVAKGARRPKSRLGGPCQPFSHNQFLLWQGRSLDGIIQCEVISSFAPLREDLLRLAAASYITELVDDVVHERDPSPDIFDLVLGLFTWLAEVEPTPGSVTHVLRAFELRLLNLCGFGPSLDACASCGTPAGDGATAFSPAAGGVVCSACRAAADLQRPSGPTSAPGPHPSPPGPLLHLAPGTLKAMRYLAAADPAQARILRLTPGAAKEMERAIREHMAYHFEHRPRSLDFLDTLLS